MKITLAWFIMSLMIFGLVIVIGALFGILAFIVMAPIGTWFLYKIFKNYFE